MKNSKGIAVIQCRKHQEVQLFNDYQGKRQTICLEIILIFYRTVLLKQHTKQVCFLSRVHECILPLTLTTVLFSFQNTIISYNQHFSAWLHCVSWVQRPITLFGNSFSARCSALFDFHSFLSISQPLFTALFCTHTFTSLSYPWASC